MTCNGSGIRLYLVKLPSKIKATFTKNSDDSYSIFVNKNLSVEMQREATIHEMMHIIRGDNMRENSADEIELLGHGV